LEHTVVSLVLSLLKREGYRLRCEVPNMGQSADIVATRGRWVTFVEAKVAAWQRALDQCTAHEQVADYICVALGSVSVADDLLRMSKRLGYGVIHCNLSEQTARWVLRPRRNNKVWAPQREYWGKLLRMIEYAEH